MIRVINFSGGHTSALMTILLKPTDKDIVLFTDTLREHPGTYQFIDEFQKHENIKVHYAVHPLGWNKFKKGLPNRTRRSCTEDLKINTAKKYLRTLGIQKFENYIGFRADEKHRIINRKQYFKKVIDKFPLDELGIIKYDVDQYWNAKPYKLTIPRILGNCDCCFLKGKAAIIRILQHNPDLADKWISDEERTGHTFIKGVTYKQLKLLSQQQLKLFSLDEITPAFNCSCTT